MPVEGVRLEGERHAEEIGLALDRLRDDFGQLVPVDLLVEDHRLDGGIHHHRGRDGTSDFRLDLTLVLVEQGVGGDDRLAAGGAHHDLGACEGQDRAGPDEARACQQQDPAFDRTQFENHPLAPQGAVFPKGNGSLGS